MIAALWARFYLYIIGATVALACLGGFSHLRYQAGVKATTARYEAVLARSAATGRDEVEKVKQQAQRDQQEHDRQQGQREQQARDEDQKRLSEAHNAAVRWQQQYQRALVTDASCQAWSQETVKCPL